MTYISPRLAVGDAVYGLFQDAALSALAVGGVHSDVPPGDKLYPFLWFELIHDRNLGGLGTYPGRGSMPVVLLRLHVYQSDYGTSRDASLVMQRAIDLLFADSSLSVDGYTVCGDKPSSEIDDIPMFDEELNGVKVKEFVTNIDITVEEITA